MDFSFVWWRHKGFKSIVGKEYIQLKPYVIRYVGGVNIFVRVCQVGWSQLVWETIWYILNTPNKQSKTIHFVIAFIYLFVRMQVKDTEWSSKDIFWFALKKQKTNT